MASSTSGDVISRRALNRATLARQHLLEREARPAIDMIEHLVGMQAQAPLAPYVALWSRIDGFAADELVALMLDRSVVRMSLMRWTVHVVSSADALRMRPWLDQMLRRSFDSSSFARDCAGVDLDSLTTAARALVENAPRTRAELGRLLGVTWPDRVPMSLAYAATSLLPAVQVTPRGVWGSTGQARWTTVEAWLGRPLEPAVSPATMFLRYLGAFGPASVMDCQKWSGVTRLGEIVGPLRPQLRVFRDENGVELLDLPDAPRPGADVMAPVRYLPEYDNVLLSHADRARVMSAGSLVPLPPGNGGVLGTILVDGTYRATWKLTREGRRASIEVSPLDRLTRTERADVEQEGQRLLAFVAPDADIRSADIATR